MEGDDITQNILNNNYYTEEQNASSSSSADTRIPDGAFILLTLISAASIGFLLYSALQCYIRNRCGGEPNTATREVTSASLEISEGYDVGRRRPEGDYVPPLTGPGLEPDGLPSHVVV
mmetsp:Transcript_53212/g.64148  ORF Transcript_53212/g.64148 Transcript_53212/m.64148 type:complete len:118 (+) Transcript_53212:182-535(+)|eukprot:CAMPEP_0172506974 /NCGR_PEP_ID=MMETSP1066-20121228/200123_1 /TAXON_ID=671091 /ORGANISM="Coscinodiscus wailesii, Strain CCMP2513" /LENGTH=117 /DNA_ID=CAMNT_0013284297 /DNA_START=167 /DNA_END=520 /DNA_ORIENTATION=+